jgi:hypothetical protein
MSSTRNRNTPNDYKLESKLNDSFYDYNVYKGYGVNKQPAYYVNGIIGKMHSSHFTHNSVDVESMLRGIRSTDLEGDSFKVTPEYKNLKELSYFDRLPLFIPEPFVHTNSERPNYLN